MIRHLLNRAKGIDPELNEVSDAIGAPREWVVCPMCGAQSWRLPPHGIGKPCPLYQSMADSVGLKFDAERNLTIQSRQQMDAMTRIFREQFGREEPEE